MTATSLSAGLRVGNYVLQEKIGAGAFAEVWKANHHERPERVVAVKIAVQVEYARQLRHEARLPDLNHPNIVPILDADTKADPPYVVMPYYGGGNLAELIQKSPEGLPEDRVTRILGEVLQGLAAAHGRDVVHRDVKPSNILFNEKGGAAIADFGLSLLSSADANRSILQSLSHDSVGVAGTYAYMAPEVRDGSSATCASDVFSVGVVLFEMLCGRRPSGVELPSDARPSMSRPDVWVGLYWWASQRPVARYPDAGTMHKALLDGPRSLSVPIRAKKPADEPAAMAPQDAIQQFRQVIDNWSGRSWWYVRPMSRYCTTRRVFNIAMRRVRLSLLREGRTLRFTTVPATDHHRSTTSRIGDIWAIDIPVPSEFASASTEYRCPHADSIITCDTCKGRGHVRCETCSGSGTQLCTRCNGSGREWIDDSDSDRGKKTCSQCDGKKIRDCWSCHALPAPICTACDARGVVARIPVIRASFGCEVRTTFWHESDSGSLRLTNPENLDAATRELCEWHVEPMSTSHSLAGLAVPESFADAPRRWIQNWIVSVASSDDGRLRMAKLEIARGSVTGVELEHNEKSFVLLVNPETGQVQPLNSAPKNVSLVLAWAVLCPVALLAVFVTIACVSLALSPVAAWLAAITAILCGLLVAVAKARAKA